MNHQATFIKNKDDLTDLTLRFEGGYSPDDAFELVQLMKDIIVLAEKNPIEDFANMLN